MVWAENYDGEVDPAELLDSESAIAAKVATAVAQPYACLPHRCRKARGETPNGRAAPVHARLLCLPGRPRSEGPQRRGEMLGKDTVAFPTYSTAWALLSLTYLDEVRFRYAVGGGSTPPFERAFDAARRAVDLDPTTPERCSPI